MDAKKTNSLQIPVQSLSGVQMSSKVKNKAGGIKLIL